jgi:hypothetical protein
MPEDVPLDRTPSLAARVLELIRRDLLLALAAFFAVVWICHRAWVQSITLDEADTFLHWIAPGEPSHWSPHSNNHVLNSLLIRFFVWLFGLGPMALRAPALIGGMLYIAAIYRMCNLVARGEFVRLALFVTFVYNPFIMDYLVAARGYGLALGFFAMALFLFSRRILREEGAGASEIRREAIWISTLAGLAICGNFTFVYAGGFLLMVSVALAAIRSSAKSAARALAAHALPALLVLLIFAGSALTELPRSQLVWGSESLFQSWRDIREASFIELNPYLVNPLFAKVLQLLQRLLFQAAAVFGIACLLLIVADRQRLKNSQAKSRLVLAASAMTILILSVAACWIQFKLMRIPLPLERTSIWVVPLAMLSLGSTVAALPFAPLSLWRRISLAVRDFGIAIVAISAVYFIGEIRDSYFRLWKDGAEAKEAFPVIIGAARRAGVNVVASDWFVTSPLRFYKVLHNVEGIDFIEFENIKQNPCVYVVVPSRGGGEILRAKDSQVVWRGAISGMAVVVRNCDR